MRSSLDAGKDDVSPAMVLTALDSLKIPYNQSPKEATSHCVFHRDTGKPNLYINLTDKPGVYHCFACGAKGGFEFFLLTATGWSRIRVLHFLRQVKRQCRAYLDELPERKAPEPIDKPEDPLAEFRFRHPYLYERKLLEGTLLRYEIGYDKSENSITFPWFNRVGELVTVKKRSVLDKFYSYPKDVDLRKVVFGIHLLKQHSIIWLCEGEIDAMYLDQCFRLAHLDKHFAVALGGSALHKDAITELLKKQPQAFVLMLDNDAAGLKAQQVIKKQLIGVAKVIEATYPREAKDANELQYEEIVQIATQIDERLK